MFRLFPQEQAEFERERRAWPFSVGTGTDGKTWGANALLSNTVRSQATLLLPGLARPLRVGGCLRLVFEAAEVGWVSPMKSAHQPSRRTSPIARSRPRPTPWTSRRKKALARPRRGQVRGGTDQRKGEQYDLEEETNERKVLDVLSGNQALLVFMHDKKGLQEMIEGDEEYWAQELMDSMRGQSLAPSAPQLHPWAEMAPGTRSGRAAR